MKVLLRKVLRGDVAIRVEFDCECGRGIGIWEGPSPNEGDQRFVELALDRVLVLGESLVPSISPSGLSLGDHGTAVVGQVIEVGEDGYVCIDFGCGRLDIEVNGTQPLLRGRYMVLTDDLKLFDSRY